MLLQNLVLLAASSVVFATNGQYPFDITTISAPDGSITAKYVSIGATLAELWVKDRHGKPRDVVLGYDDNTKLLTDPAHPYFNAIVGRYANRIKNGTFSIPITKLPQPDGPNVYHTPLNNHNNEVTLHGGIVGYDRRNWTIVAKSHTSVTYKHIDTADEGFPGNVTTYATHSVHNGGVMTLKLHATATQKTPIMLSQHLYINLDAFQDGVDTVLDHNMQFAASKVIDVDGDQIPTGRFIDVTGTPFDFRKGERIGERINQTVGLCGAGCNGYDHAWVFDRPVDPTPRTSLWSEKSGIRLDISSNQPAVQHYTSYTLNVTRKAIHGGPNKVYGAFAAAVLEQEGLIDAINTPEWGVDQIYYPGKDYEWEATYKFSQLK